MVSCFKSRISRKNGSNLALSVGSNCSIDLRTDSVIGRLSMIDLSCSTSSFKLLSCSLVCFLIICNVLFKAFSIKSRSFFLLSALCAFLISCFMHLRVLLNWSNLEEMSSIFSFCMATCDGTISSSGNVVSSCISVKLLLDSFNIDFSPLKVWTFCVTSIIESDKRLTLFSKATKSGTRRLNAKETDSSSSAFSFCFN
ncbi:hypothetical protein TRFO_07225 [Tritrichomonas foetus]|uniref:Uncharacterized protein n=1 Tax=Tritrichomonas foetus TaxID=1144522 RepID=A0A1J4JVA1_9EUKA|nr:hypothetical protein TRFO_07225 [Tritrichomonas foetus]|eukprot:OHT02360.1 hypothetical protein TRFO_07225 [Tritrichomonas foetus]